ncbi:MAG: M50 family metallopeptidase [Clostridia bacterium]|nr:M50 family metallopeptidase [Clostridia bacterium]
MKKHPEFSVHPFAPAGLFLLLFASSPIYAFAVLSSVFLHEMGHAIAALLLRKKILGIRIVPTGINITLSAAASYAEEWLIAAAGPLMNILYAFSASLLPYSVGGTVRSISLLLGGLNLLPLALLDGGRMLNASISSLFGIDTAKRISELSTFVFLGILWTFALYIFFYSGVNFMLLLFCAYLFSYIVLKKF